MSTVLCPRLVALDPSVCNSVTCRSSHTHEPAFCDPCKAVHAAVHAGIHQSSIGHRLRVDGPVAPVRCVVCAPLSSGPPSAPFVFIGPEHYAAHARTSAHRAKLAQLPPQARMKTKPDFGLGLGRPGDGRPFAYTRSSSAGNPYSPPQSRNVTPTPGASRPGSSMSMSFNAPGPAFGETPPGPPPVALDHTEYVICALCHTVLPVPSEVAPISESGQRNVSGGSDATVRGRDDDDMGSVVTTTENDTEVRQSLVLANHMSTDSEHARRVKFPKFRAAYEKKMARERRETAEVEEEREEEAPPVVEFASRLTGTPAAIPMTRSPDQLSLSSLSSSPSVGVDGLDEAPTAGSSGSGGGLFFHQHHRHRRAVSQDREPAPEPKYKYSRDDDFVMQRQRSKSRYETSSNGSSERAQVSPPVPAPPAPGAAPRIKTQTTGIEPPAYVREHNLPITIPEHLLPFLSPITPSTATPEEELEAYGRSPTSEYLRALPIETLSTPIRTTFMYKPQAQAQPQPAQIQTSASVSASESSTTPDRPTLLPIPEQDSPTASSIRSRPYEPSPSPPPRLAFDDAGKVIKLGSFGWERQTGPMYDDPQPGQEGPERQRSTSAAAPRIPLLGLGLSPQPPSPSPSPPPVPPPVTRSVSQPVPSASVPVAGLVPAPPSDSESEEEEEKEPVKEKSVVSGSVGTVQVQRYTLGREASSRSGSVSGSVRSTSTVPGRSSTMQYPGRSSTQQYPSQSSSQQYPTRSSPGQGQGRSSTQYSAPAPARSSLDHARASTLGPNRSSGPSRTTSATLGANRTTTATRPVAPRTSTSEWSILGGSGSGSGFDEFGARLGGGSGGFGSRQVASLGARPSTESWFNRSPSPLFDTSRPSSSASEASQIIRAFDSPDLDLNLGTPEMLSPRRSSWGIGETEPSSSPEKSSPGGRGLGHAKQQSLSMSSSSRAIPVPRSSGSPSPAGPSPNLRASSSLRSGPSHRSSSASPALRSGSGSPALVHGPKPSRPFSPTQAWNGLTPASDSSRSSSPSLGEFESEHKSEEFEPKSFDEEAFLNDIKFGIARAIESRVGTPSAGSPVVERDGPVLGGSSGLPVVGRSASPVPGGSTPPLVGRSSSPIPGRSSSPLAGRSTSPATPHARSPPHERSTSPSPGKSTPTTSPHGKSASTPSTQGKSNSISSAHGKQTSPTYGKSASPLYGRSTPTPSRPPMRPPRVSSPLAIKIGPTARPISPGPRTGISDYSAAGRTRRRARPMGTGSVVGGGGSVVGGGGSVVGGGGSVVRGQDESVVGGSAVGVGSLRRDSIASSVSAAAEPEEDSTADEESVVSQPPVPEAEDVAESPIDEFGSLLPQASSRPVSGSAFDSPASVPGVRRRVRGPPDSIISDTTSEAASSVVSLLSPGLVAQLEATGLHVDPERVPTSEEVDAVVHQLAGMNMDEPPMTIERVDSDSGFTSPIVPPGAPSVAGSLFSRAVSPRPVPTKARLGAVRLSTPSSKPAKSTSAAPGSSVRARRRPDSAVAPIPSTSTAPDVSPESIFSSGANMRRSADPAQVPMPRTRSVFSRGPGSVVSAISSASKQAGGLLSRFQASGSKPVADAPRSSKAPKKMQQAPTHSDDFDGGLTSSEEEGDDEDDDDSETKTATVDDDGLDHLTESIGDPTPEQPPVVEKPVEAERPVPVPAQNVQPMESREQPKPTTSKLPGGFGSEIVDQPLTVSPQLMPTADPALLQSIEGEPMMPDEVLALNPVICDACYAPMPLAKWTEHASKSSHRRNAARYSQLVFEQTSPNQKHDSRERWAEAMRIKPRPARSSEYAFCDVCAVFLLRGDVEHFQGKKHYRCVRAAALNDADELESVRGSVSDEEDGPSARAFRAAAAATSGTLGQQVFQRAEASAE